MKQRMPSEPLMWSELKPMSPPHKMSIDMCLAPSTVTKSKWIIDKNVTHTCIQFLECKKVWEGYLGNFGYENASGDNTGYMKKISENPDLNKPVNCQAKGEL